MKKKLLLILPIVVILLAAGSITWLYTGTLNDAKIKVFAKVPLPAAIVDKKLLSAQDLIQRIDLAAKFPQAEAQGSAATRAQLFDRLIDSKKLQVIADKKDISVSGDDVDREYQDVVLQYGDGDEAKFNEELKTQFGLSEGQFKHDVLRLDVLQSKLAIWFNSQENLNQSPYTLAKGLKDKLNQGESFDSVATAYTQDEATKDFAGDSGFIAFTDLLPEFQAALKDTSANEVKQVVSRSGLHIVKVLERDNNGENGAERIHLQQIYVQTGDFSKWYTDEAAGIKVTKLLKV